MMQRTFDLIEPLKLREDGDLNIVEGWIVPYNQPADVYDITPEGVHRYREGFLPGSCQRMVQGVHKRGNAGFIRLTLDHEQTMGARVGCGLTLEERGSEGAWASFKLYRSDDLTKVRSMIEQSHDGFSVEFDDVVPPIEKDGVTWRRQVAIPAVTLTPQGAYGGAKVMALRDGDALGGTEHLDETMAWLESMRASD